MGNKSNKNSQKTLKFGSDEGPPKFKAIKNQYESVEQVTEALQKSGLESSNLIIGIDYTISNTDAGKNTFGGKSLHWIDPTGATFNPYQHTISVLSRTLEQLDDDKLIPVFGFGDKTTQDKSVFPFYPDRPCHTVNEVLKRYNEITPKAQLAGPTSFAPIIREAIQICKSQNAYHILIIIADGQVTHDSEYCQATAETTQAIVNASNYPLSIIMVGVGDGPWDEMEVFDDELPERKFDNFQFVNFHNEYQGQNMQIADANFALAALQEIPEQYYYIKKLGYLNGE